MSGNKALKPFLAAVAAATSRTAEEVGDPLNELLGDTSNPVGTGHSGDLMGILGFLAARNPEESVDLGAGGKALVQDLQGTIQAAVEAAAVDAEEEAKDSTVVNAPLARLEEAIVKVQRASDILSKARTLQDWKEQDFQSLVAKLQKMLTKLELIST